MEGEVLVPHLCYLMYICFIIVPNKNLLKLNRCFKLFGNLKNVRFLIVVPGVFGKVLGGVILILK